MLATIVAIGKNHAIGKNNQLLWHLPDDLKYFKEMTSGHAIIMGKKTFDSLPFILPNRQHIILTHHPEQIPDHPSISTYSNIDDLISALPEDELHFVVGGGEIYRGMMPHVSTLYITEVDDEPDADTFFPTISDDWTCTKRIHHPTDDKHAHAFDFCTYEKK